MLFKRFLCAVVATGLLCTTPVTTMANTYAFEQDARQELNIPDVNIRKAIVTALRSQLTEQADKDKFAGRELIDYALYQSDLQDIAKLTVFDLQELIPTDVAKVTNLQGLEYMTGLKELSVSGTQVSGLGYINLLSPSAKSGITKLTHNNVANGTEKVSDLTPISAMTGLKEVSISNQNVADISVFANKPVTTLILDKNNISNVEPFSSKTFGYLDMSAQRLKTVAIKDSTGKVVLPNPIRVDLVKDLNFTNVSNGGSYVAGSDSLVWNNTTGVNSATVSFAGKVSNTDEANYSGTITVEFVDAITGAVIKGADKLVKTEGDSVDLLAGVSASDSTGRDLTSYVQLQHNVPLDSNGIATIPGSYKAMYKLVVQGKTYASVTRDVVIEKKAIPNTPPVINANDITLSVKEELNIKQFVSATDAEDGVIPDNKIIITHTVPTTVLGGKIVASTTGNYTATVSVTDSMGLNTTKTISVKVNPEREPVDNKPPVISAQDVVKKKVGDIFEPYVYAKATDPEDGVLSEDRLSISHSIPLTKEGDFYEFSKEGRYMLTYTATDRFGKSSSKSIRVEVELSEEDKKLEAEKEKNKAPVIKVKVDEAELRVGDEFDIFDYISVEDEDRDIKDKVKYTGISTTRKDKKYYVDKTGDFEVKITVEDKFGESDKEYIDVKVLPKELLAFDKLPTNSTDFEDYMESLTTAQVDEVKKEFMNRLPYFVKEVDKELEKKLGLSTKVYDYDTVVQNGVEYISFKLDGVKDKGDLKVRKFSLTSGPSTFNDMVNHWAKEPVSKMSQKGIMVGKTSTSFNPNDNLTNEEAMVILNRLLLETGNTPVRGRDNVYPLVKSIEARWSYMDVASYFSFMNAKTNVNSITHSQATSQITREELAKLIQPVLEAANVRRGNQQVSYKDSGSIQYKSAVDFCSSLGLFVGDNDGNFNPKSNLTRAEMSAVAERLYNLMNK